MSKVLDVLKRAPGAIRDVEADLPRSEQGIRDFPGKGFLTALVDVSGSELQRQRKIEDDLKHSMVKPLIEKYWMGNEAEREAVADQIKSVLGGGKQTKAFLNKMFEVGGQIHSTNKILQPPPQVAEGAAQEAVQASNQDQAGSSTDMAEPTSMLPPPPVSPPMSQASPTPGAPPAMPSAPPIEGPQPQPPLESFLSKAFPQGLGEREKLQIMHDNDMEKVKAQSDNAMALMREQIEAGRFDKALARVKGIEVDPDTGKAMNVIHWFDKDGTEVKKDTLGEAPRNWANRPRAVFARDEQGRLYSTMLDPLTNKETKGVERRYDVVPPAALLPRISQRDYVTLDDDGNLVTIPLRSVSERLLPGASSGALGGATGQGPGTSPTATSVPDDAIVNFVMSKNKNLTRAQAADALSHTPPETLAGLRQEAASSGFLSAPPSTTTMPGSTPPSTLPGGTPGGASGVGGAGVPPVQTPVAGPASISAPKLESQKFGNVLPTGQWNLSKQREIPVREAYTQMVGAPEFPDMPSMKTYAHIADNPVKRDKLAKALRLTFDGIEQDEKAHGSLTNLLKLYVGIPAAEINARVATYTQGIGEMLKGDPELQDAYNATMAMFGTAVGLRSLTKASQAQSSVATIERELPVIGVNSFSSRDLYSKLGRIMLEVYNGAKNTPTVPEHELEYIRSQVDELNRLARGSSISAPPGARGSQGGAGGPGGSGNVTAPALPAGRIRVRLKSSGKTGTIDEGEFDAKTMERVTPAPARKP